MASKNMTTIMALYLTFNLVFLGLTTAQTPPPPANQPQCPVDLVDLQVCLNVFTNVVNLRDPANIVNPQDQAQCCTLLTKFGGPVVALCSCELARTRVPGVANASIITASANQFLNVCPGVTSLITFIKQGFIEI
ncbi:hypothetical protein IGI04_040613 [Brassica rapa subsp. trilocularis]|uniref:Hydrophobic seed protein domain-containing protein n=1 Tax=Brassica rapa subsp. trilocularis TaxID=1813537 RepID=A0ABQ7KPY6_BRACM|nr:hypothetical protein IGI04_040613 [Brassica rapa subsp. trilocularis]